MQEFSERLRIFTSNAKGIREGNARIKEEEGEGAEVRSCPHQPCMTIKCKVSCEVCLLFLARVSPDPSVERMLSIQNRRWCLKLY